MRTCSFAGCDRKHYARGLCGSHSWQVRNGKALQPIALRIAKICSFEGCDRKHKGNGLCEAHNRQFKKGLPLIPILTRTGLCSFPECKKPHEAKGLCAGHRAQIKRGQYLVPLLSKNRVCGFKGCNLKYKSKGFCVGHYTQMIRGHFLTSLYSTKNKEGMGRNPERKKLMGQRGSRRREEREANAVGFCSPSQLEARIEYYGYHCAYCPGPFEHVDHVIPLSKGGTAWPSNLVPACASCNCSKGAKNVWEWLAMLKIEVVCK